MKGQQALTRHNTKTLKWGGTYLFVRALLWVDASSLKRSDAVVTFFKRPLFTVALWCCFVVLCTPLRSNVLDCSFPDDHASSLQCFCVVQCFLLQPLKNHTVMLLCRWLVLRWLAQFTYDSGFWLENECRLVYHRTFIDPLIIVQRDIATLPLSFIL